MENTNAAVDFSNLLSPSPRAIQRHRVRWFLDDGEVLAEFECLHPPVPAGHFCDGETAREDQWVFLESFTDDKTPLRDGVIKSWWTGQNEDCQMSWKYVDEPEQ